MADVIETARRFRSAARRRGTAARALLAERYARAATATVNDAMRLEARVLDREFGRATVPAELLRQRDDVRGFRAGTRARLLRVADTVETLLTSDAAREVKHARLDAQALVRAATKLDLPDQVRAVAVENLVALTDKGPLLDLLERRAGSDADRAVDILVDGFVRGRPVREMAGDLRGVITGGSMADALRIVKTETHRARREAQRVVYSHDRRVLGWTWVCSMSPTSCGLCWAQHGRHFGTNEPMATHPNCSCECAPWYGEPVDTGVDLFDALTDAEQDTAIGGAAGRAYRAGAIRLSDLVLTGRHDLWGPTGVQRSLVSVLGDRAADFYV